MTLKEVWEFISTIETTKYNLYEVYKDLNDIGIEFSDHLMFKKELTEDQEKGFMLIKIKYS